MTTKLLTYNASLALLKQAPLTTLTDDILSRYTLDNHYAAALRTTLELGKWNHAARSVAIDASVDEEPEFGYTFAFEKPDDFARIVKISASETFWPLLTDYANEGAFFFANTDPLYLSYVSTDTAYGGDLSLWPQIAATFLEHELAERIAPLIPSLGDDAMDRLKRDKQRAKRTAKGWDAQQQPSEPPPPSRLIQARYWGRRFNSSSRT